MIYIMRKKRKIIYEHKKRRMNFMGRTIKTVKGITLVALVITIIILLMLVGITLGFVFGKNGIIGIAQNAGKNYVTAQKEESNTLEKLYSSMLVATNDDSNITVSIQELRKIIQEEVQKAEGTGPTGTVISYMGNTVPEGYLACDGTTYNITDYPTLSTQIQEQFGNVNYFGGDGETTFAVPDLRGEFLRGTGKNKYTDQGNGSDVGIHQNATKIPESYQTGDALFTSDRQFLKDYDTVNQQAGARTRISGTTDQSWGGYYTSRPTNTSVLYCIKY